MPKYSEIPATYRNPWHKPDDRHYGPRMYECDAVPEEYQGFLIYHRIRSTAQGADVFDVVRDGVCITQRAGPKGARAAIDALKGVTQ